MNYATGAAFNMKEMFENFSYNKLKITCKKCKKINNDLHRDKLVMKIFRECYKIVLLDIIDNNITFELPVGKRRAYINMRRVTGEDFKRARRNGKWRGVDFISSSFSGYELVLTMERNGVPRSKNIYVNKELKNLITLNTNNGKQYC